MRSRILSVAVVASTVALWVVPGASATSIHAEFPLDNEGFELRTLDPPGPASDAPAEWVSTGGNPGGFIRHTDVDGSADPEIIEDLRSEFISPGQTERADYGATLSFDMRTNTPGGTTSVTIQSANGLVYCGLGAPNTSWSTFSVVADASEPCWFEVLGTDTADADQDAMERALDGGEISIDADHNGAFGELTDMDNFEFLGFSPPPETTITAGPPDGSTISNDSPSFEFSSNEANSTFQCALDFGAYAACTSPETLSGLSDGSHSFQVRAIDADGNTDPSPATRTFTVDAGLPPDTTPPETTIASGPAEGSTIADDFASFTFTSEAGATFECKLDDGAYTACTSPRDLTSLADGSHTFSARAIDEAGNTDASPASRTFTIDSTPPVVTIDGIKANARKQTAKVSFSATDALSTAAEITFTCQLDQKDPVACTSPIKFKKVKKGPHFVQIVATDAAGNASNPVIETFKQKKK